MSDIQHFFTPIKPLEHTYSENKLGSVVVSYTNENDFPDITNVDIAIIGVCESRNANNNNGCFLAPDVVRSYLYNLYQGTFRANMIDLGNIQPGHEVDDTYYALKTTIEYLIRSNVIPIIIGGSQDLTYAQFLGYEKLEQTINIVSIDSSFDIGDPQESITNHSFLGKIILHQPNFLFNYSNIGYQTYLVDPTALNMMNRLYFDTYRLGQVRDKIEESEPILRHADMLSFDISAIKHADAPASPHVSPNGFYSEEACQMMRYAGMNDKLTSVGIYEINPEFDINGKTASLAAQMIWCFADGFYNRKNDFPSMSSKDYVKFHVVLQDGKYNINFYKSKKSDRWWMEVPYPLSKGLKFERHTLLPCSFKDYESAVNNEMPDRWWQTYQKLA
ncbi:MAG: formimidoylglutamase [Bacteroidota bacterium]|jgi:arginase family enzyme